MLRPLWNNVWGVAIYHRPFREESTIHTPFANQRKKLENLVLVKEVGDRCVYVKPGDIVIIPEDHGGSVITVFNGKETEYRFCFKETVALCTWDGDLPQYTTEAGIIEL